MSIRPDWVSMIPNWKTPSPWQRFLVALLIIAAASAFRIAFFGGLDRGIPFLLYYPAVMLAALYGGLSAGLLATALSAPLIFFWIQRGFMSPPESLALVVFVISCILISFVCEAMHRSHARTKLAETAQRETSEYLAETKALLQAAMDCSQAGIAIADAPSGNLRYVNQAGLLIGGEAEEKLVAGVEVDQYVASWKLLNLDGTPLAKEEVPLARAVLFGEQCTREFIIRRSEHDDRIVLANAAPIRNQAGAVTAGIVVFLDITEHKRAEDLLRQNTEELRARNEELTRFNRLMAGRELRTIELKQQVNDLAAQLGQSRPYPLAFLDAAAAEVVRTTPKPGEQGAEIRGQKSEVSDQKSEVSNTQKEKSP